MNIAELPGPTNDEKSRLELPTRLSTPIGEKVVPTSRTNRNHRLILPRWQNLPAFAASAHQYVVCATRGKTKIVVDFEGNHPGRTESSGRWAGRGPAYNDRTMNPALRAF
jgi:hypothetical protein